MNQNRIYKKPPTKKVDLDGSVFLVGGVVGLHPFTSSSELRIDGLMQSCQGSFGSLVEPIRHFAVEVCLAAHEFFLKHIEPVLSRADEVGTRAASC